LVLVRLHDFFFAPLLRLLRPSVAPYSGSEAASTFFLSRIASFFPTISGGTFFFSLSFLRQYIDHIMGRPLLHRKVMEIFFRRSPPPVVRRLSFESTFGRSILPNGGLRSLTVALFSRPVLAGISFWDSFRFPQRELSPQDTFLHEVLTDFLGLLPFLSTGDPRISFHDASGLCSPTRPVVPPQVFFNFLP